MSCESKGLQECQVSAHNIIIHQLLEHYGCITQPKRYYPSICTGQTSSEMQYDARGLFSIAT